MKKARTQSGNSKLVKAASARIPVPSGRGAGWRLRGPGGSVTSNTPSTYPTMAKRPGRRVIPQPPDAGTVPWPGSAGGYSY